MLGLEVTPRPCFLRSEALTLATAGYVFLFGVCYYFTALNPILSCQLRGPANLISHRLRRVPPQETVVVVYERQESGRYYVGNANFATTLVLASDNEMQYPVGQHLRVRSVLAQAFFLSVSFYF